MIILGIDPGSQITGFGFIQKTNNQLTHLENGLIDCRKKKDFPDRLVTIFQNIRQIIEKFNPSCVAIESIFYAKNVQSAIKLGQARGVALVSSSLLNLPVFEYTPLEVKQAVVGYGQASKEQVQQMIKRLLKLPQVAEENASDALAIAICHAHSHVLKSLSA